MSIKCWPSELGLDTVGIATVSPGRSRSSLLASPLCHLVGVEQLVKLIGLLEDLGQLFRGEHEETAAGVGGKQDGSRRGRRVFQAL